MFIVIKKVYLQFKNKVMNNFSKGNNKVFQNIQKRKLYYPILREPEYYENLEIERARVKYRYAAKRWFGLKGFSLYENFLKQGIAVRYVNVDFLECECYAPDPEYDDCSIYFIITEDELERIVKGRRDLYDFLTSAGVTMVNFILMEMPEKLFHLCQYYDIIELLGLDDDIEAIPREELILKFKCDNKRK